MVEYIVIAVPGGWMLSGGVNFMPLVFLSGAKAEAKAKELAVLGARSGWCGEVRIVLADGSLAGRRVYSPFHVAA
jgi:hypothetical protein